MSSLDNPHRSDCFRHRQADGCILTIQQVENIQIQLSPSDTFTFTLSSVSLQPKGGNILTTGEEIRQPGQSQIGGCTCKIPLDIRVLRLFPATEKAECMSLVQQAAESSLHPSARLGPFPLNQHPEPLDDAGL